MSSANRRKRCTYPCARAQPLSCLDMLDRSVKLPRPTSDRPADVPAARKARIKHQRAVHQSHHCSDIIAEIGERVGRVSEGGRILGSQLQGSPGELDTPVTVAIRIVAAVHDKPKMANRGQSESGPITRIPLDRLLQKAERPRNLRRRRYDHRV